MSRWQFLKQNWVMSLIVLVVLLMAVAAIVYAVLTKEGDEGFLRGSDGEILRWERSSLPLSCMYSDAAEKHQEYIDFATDTIHERVGNVIGICRPWLLKKPFPTKPARGVILVTLGTDSDGGEGVYVSSPFDPKHGGVTSLFADRETGKLYGAIIKVDPSVSKELLNRVYLHEFLHAFGLAHDRLKGSIMYPNATGRGKDLSSKDVERLKEVYVK